MLHSLQILLIFIAGLFLGVAAELPGWLLSEDTALYALWIFMFLAGYSIGADKDLPRILKNVRLNVLYLPLATTVGTFAGMILSAPILRMPVSDCLAVGAGFGYYSLSSIFITQYKGPELGTVALVANIMRELVTIVLMPLLVARLGPKAAIACGGCTTMDTALPFISRYAGAEWILPAIIHGLALDFTVPFWVALFCSL